MDRVVIHYYEIGLKGKNHPLILRDVGAEGERVESDNGAVKLKLDENLSRHLNPILLRLGHESETVAKGRAVEGGRGDWTGGEECRVVLLTVRFFKEQGGKGNESWIASLPPSRCG